MLKLYVLMAMVEVFDRLMCSFGQDALDSLYWNTTRRPTHPRMVVSFVIVFAYACVHSYVLFVHITTLNVAMNSADHALLSLLIGGNFAEIKSTVFKKYNKQNLFKITSSDVCERFKIGLFLSLVLLLNCCQGGMDRRTMNNYLKMTGLTLLAEVVCDWIKHSFITKFNFIPSKVYVEYTLILAGDVSGIGHEGVDIDPTHAVVKRLGFAQIPLVCVMARYLKEAGRYAGLLEWGTMVGDVNSNGDVNSGGYEEDWLGWCQGIIKGGNVTASALLFLGVYTILLVVKILLGHTIEKAAHRIIFAKVGEIDEEEVEVVQQSHRRQVV